MLAIVRAAGLSRSVEVTILEEAVLEREPLLLSLTPLLVVKVDVGALKLVFRLKLGFENPNSPVHIHH